MKSTLVAIMLLTLMSISTKAEVNVECYYHFTDSTLEITPEMGINSCTADFVWGAKNVCYRGDAEELVELINSDYFRWGHSLRVLEAELVNENLIEFTGVDAQNFYSSRFNINRCND